MKVSYRTRQVGDVNVFYREAGPANAPVILLLHGFPTSSHMFRELIPLLADSYRVIAPDLPGAEAYKRDIPDADVRFLDTGHFALETHATEISQAMRDFLRSRL